MDIRKYIPPGHDGDGYKRRPERIKRYIHQNLSADLRASTVAQKFGLSISTLLHIFKEYENQPFGQYVTQARMKEAFQIISNGGRVKEAMYATGYKVKSTFRRAYKRTFGYPPGYFRQ